MRNQRLPVILSRWICGLLFVGTTSFALRAVSAGPVKTQAAPATQGNKAKESTPQPGATIPTITGSPADKPGAVRSGESTPSSPGTPSPVQNTVATQGANPGQTPGTSQQTPATGGSAPPAAPRVYMPDGQLTSHLITVYVDRDIQENQHPQLWLSRSHTLTKKASGEDDPIGIYRAAPAHWHENDNGADVSQSGTMLLLRLQNERLGGRAMVRVRPIVTWDGGGKAVGENEVNLGDILMTSVWTIAIVVLAVALVLVLTWRAKPAVGVIGFLQGVDGHLSLGQTQMACWTIAVGGVVLGYGMLRHDVPTIPGSLLALMGASLVTGGVAFFQDGQNSKAQAAAPVAPAAPAPAVAAAPQALSPSLSDLVRTFTGSQAGSPSLAKGQMIFWTVLLLSLFISKSILDGVIWDIPWALVALMGFSQAGYLAPKLAPQ
jgi:hypothetical protein